MTLASGSAERMIARFAGRLQSATLTRPGDSAIDPDDPTAAPDGVDMEFSVEGYAFAYQRRDIDESRILKDDYQVILLRSSAVLPQTGDVIDIPPPGESSPRDGRVVRIEAVTQSFCTLQVRG